MPFYGKITRLPRDIREQLNHRLADGEPTGTLLTWLNALPQVQRTLTDHFGGRPISKVNLTEWKQRGHADWLARQETMEKITQLADTSESCHAAAGGRLADHLGTVVAARYASILAGWDGQDTAEFRATLRILRQFVHDISLLRRGDLSASRVAVHREWFDLARSKTEQELADYFLDWFNRDSIRNVLTDGTLTSTQRREQIHKLLGVGQPLPHGDTTPDPEPDPVDPRDYPGS